MGSAGVAGVAGVKYGLSQVASPRQVVDCPHCDQPLVYPDDLADGYHTSDSACMRAQRKAIR